MKRQFGIDPDPDMCGSKHRSCSSLLHSATDEEVIANLTKNEDANLLTILIRFELLFLWFMSNLELAAVLGMETLSQAL